jgi:hypothetical protein
MFLPVHSLLPFVVFNSTVFFILLYCAFLLTSAADRIRFVFTIRTAATYCRTFIQLYAALKMPSTGFDNHIIPYPGAQ